jgi:2-hydroxychromene-2-carboxylate isomerase
LRRFERFNPGLYSRAGLTCIGEDVALTNIRTTPVEIECYFSFISLWSYVGSLEFAALARARSAIVRFKPIDLMAIFAAGGGKPVKQRPLQRQAYRLVEMQRWRDRRRIPLVLHPKFYPADPSLAHRVLLAAAERKLEYPSSIKPLFPDV